MNIFISTWNEKEGRSIESPVHLDEDDKIKIELGEDEIFIHIEPKYISINSFVHPLVVKPRASNSIRVSTEEWEDERPSVP